MAREITTHITNDRLAVIIKPNAPVTSILHWDETQQALRISIAAPPTDGRANKELLKFLAKQTGRTCEIQSGTTSRRKLIRFS